MARQPLVAQTPTSGGTTPAWTAAHTDGHSFNNSSGRATLEVKNGGVGASVITIATPGVVDGLAVPDKTVSIPAGEARDFRFPKKAYNQADDTVNINFSVLTSVTLRVVE